ncbi:MAG TPA: hypothetical protein VHW23_27450 [Kofleriaceae bacterium]|nr:hypothetical protein [Kofleriaceae bacterium]
MNKIALIALCVGLVACMNKKKDEEGKEPVQAAPVQPPPAPAGSSATPGSQPSGSGSAAAVPSGTAAAEAARAPSGGATLPTPEACATPSKRACPAGQVDGCTGGLTSVHVCVATDAKPGAPCAQGAALTCANDAIDACGFAPPYASNHVCVVVPKPAP